MEKYKGFSREQIQKEIKRLKTLYAQKNAEQNSIKQEINSMYGVFLSEFFYFYNPDIGRSITLTGQNITQTAGKMINKYFLEVWHIDKKVHDKMGIYNVKPITQPPWVYSDTDSAFVTFEEVYKSCEGWEGIEEDFILSIYNLRLEKYFNACFEKYVKNLGGKDNYLNFEPEKIAKSAIWCGKKSYSLNITWKMGKGGGTYFKTGDNITATGIEAVKRTTPPFCRERFYTLLDKIHRTGKKISLKELAKDISEIKNEFALLEVEKMCGTKSVNNYNKYIIDDSTSIVIGSKTPAHVKASAYFNHLLLKNKEYKEKYNFIKDGDKVKIYNVKTKDPILNTFAFLPDEFPYEFAPEVDIEVQFEKFFIIPFNRILTALGMSKLNSDLIISDRLF